MIEPKNELLNLIYDAKNFLIEEQTLLGIDFPLSEKNSSKFTSPIACALPVKTPIQTTSLNQVVHTKKAEDRQAPPLSVEAEPHVPEENNMHMVNERESSFQEMSQILAKLSPSLLLEEDPYNIVTLSFDKDPANLLFLEKLNQAIHTHISPTKLMFIDKEKEISSLLKKPHLRVALAYKSSLSKLPLFEAAKSAKTHELITFGFPLYFLLLEERSRYEQDVQLKKSLWQFLKSSTLQNMLESPLTSSLEH